MRIYLIILSLSLFIISACDRYPDPGYENLESDYFHFYQESGKRLFSGDLVSDSIQFNVRSYIPDKIKRFRVDFDVVAGGGVITSSSGMSDPSGNVFTGWTLGNKSFQQKLRAKVYDESGYYLSSSTLTAYGFRENTWDTVNFLPGGSINSMISDKQAMVTYMIAQAKVYRQGAKYFDWEEVKALSDYSAFEIDKDNNGVIYLSTWKGEFLKSIDHGASWTICSKPYPEDPYYVYSTISNDNSLWAFKWGFPTRVSSDGGKSWKNMGVPIEEEGFGDAWRMADGSIIFHGSDCCSMYRSTDNGSSWYHIPTPGLSLKMYSDGLKTIYVVTQENGLTFYKSDDYGATYKNIHRVAPSWGTTRKHKMFQYVEGIYWILVPGYGIIKSADLVKFEDYWANSNLTDLYFDHNGLIIAKDWKNTNTVYYRKNSAGN